MSRITTPFGFHSTAAEVLEGVDLSGRSAIVTGGASGIGIETARALAGAGAVVTVAVRRPEAARAAAADIIASTGNAEVHVAPLDLVDPASVAAFVAAWEGPLHILVNNAGIMAVPTLERSPAGHEMQLATNFLGHFALTNGLHGSLAKAGGARVVCVSSNGHHLSRFVFEDFDYITRPYDPWSAYGQSKTAEVLHAVEVNRRWSDAGIFANALHPGAIATNLQQHTGGLQTPVDKRKNPEEGAATSVLLAGSPLLDGVGGRYFEDCNEAEVVNEPVMFGGGVAPYTLDSGNAERLWDLAVALTARRIRDRAPG